MLMTIGFAVATKHIRHFKPAIHVPGLKVLWWSGLGLSDNRLGSRSSGLVVEHTLVVAMRR